MQYVLSECIASGKLLLLLLKTTLFTNTIIVTARLVTKSNVKSFIFLAHSVFELNELILNNKTTRKFTFLNKTAMQGANISAILRPYKLAYAVKIGLTHQ